MESDDNYESFSFPNNAPSPSPSPKHRRLKRLKKSTVVADQPPPVESVSELIGLPRVDFARLEALESSDIGAFDDSSEPILSPPTEGFIGDGKGKEPSSGFDDTGDLIETERVVEFEAEFGDDDGKVKELSSCYDDAHVNGDREERSRDLGFEEGFDGDGVERKSGSGVGDMPVRTERKETKRALEFDDEINEIGVDQEGGKGESMDIEIRGDGKKEGHEGAVSEKKGKKKRLKSSGEEPKAKTSSSNKRREVKERRAHLEQLHAESQRLLRETRSAAFKPVPVVQKPISSILERIRQRKLEVSKKFSQSTNSGSVEENDFFMKEAVIDHPKSVETEVGDLSESVKEEKVISVQNGESESGSGPIHMDGLEVCREQKSCENACSQKALDEESKPAFRAPVEDTQELFDDCETSNSKESKEDEPSEQINSSQEEEMEPSTLTMKLKLDSAPDDISDEEDNDKENIAPHVHEHAEERSPKGDPVKAFLDDEAEEEDDSDNDLMRFGDDEEDEDDGDAEELREMIATGYEEKPIDKETRNELHQKWLEEKDAAGTDDLLRRLNVASELRGESLLDEEEDEEDVEMNDDVEEDVERPRVARIDSRKKAKEMIAQMFADKDEGFLSSDDEETEKLLVRQRFLDKAEEKSKLVSPLEDEDSREVFGLIKKLNIVPDVRKKPKSTSFLDTMLTRGDSSSSSKSSFLSRASSNSVPISSKQGSSVVRSFIFGRDDSNSRSSISISEDTTETITRETETKKVTAKYSSSQSQVRSSVQTTKHSSSSSSSSLFEILRRSSSVQSENNVVELSQSVFAAFKIPKKPMKIQGRV